MWCNDVNLIEICSKLINESLDLIKKDENFEKIYKMDLFNLKFKILLNELNEDKLFENYMKIVNELQDLELKFIKLKELENKLTNKKYLQQYYCELLNLLIELNNCDNKDFLKEVFTKYCKLNNIDNNLIDKIFNNLNDEVVLNFVTILFNESDYNRNNLLQILLNIKIINNKFIPFFKNLFKEINLNKINLNELIEFIKNYQNDLQDELIIIYKELYKNSSDIKYLEVIYDLNVNNKEFEILLLNEYLKLNLIDKYFNLFIKINDNKFDSFNIMLLKLLQNQNNKINEQNKEINILQQLNTNQNYKIINLQQFLTNQNKNIDEQNKKIIKLQQTIEDLNNSKNILQNQNSNLQIELSILNDWKNQPIINNFKKKYPKYDYVNIINIKTPLNVKKGEYCFSNVFEVFGLNWKISIFPKGSRKSKENECTILLYLNSLQYQNEEEKEIFSIKIDFLIDSINLNDNRKNEYNFIKVMGKGNASFKQSNFIPIIKNDKQIFSVVIGMKKLDIE
ncbi:hypothetical protein ABK040_016422, partial [Willaertia magna]